MSDSREKSKAIWIALAVAAALLVLLYWRVFAYFIPRWFSEAPYRQCAIVPLLVAWLVWRQRKALADERLEPSVAGLVVLALGLLVYIAGGRTGVRLMVGASLPILLLGLVGALAGTRVLKRLAIPILLTFFLVPVPRHVLGYIAFPMQIVSAHATAVLTRLSGLAVAHHGVDLVLGGFTFEVAQECSGLNSLLALLVAACVLVELMNLSLGRKLLVLVAAPFIVLVANIVRLVLVLWTAAFVGPEVALNSLVHGTSDAIIYGTAVVLLLLVIQVVQKGFHPSSHAVALLRRLGRSPEASQ